MNPIEQERLIQTELAAFRQQFVVEDLAAPCCVQAVLRHLHEHLFNPGLNVNILLDCCKIRGASIHGRFKYYLQMTIRQYLEHKRMLAAMWLLWHDKLDLAHIAFSIGYAHYETFTRAFRRHVGCTPGEYRKRMSEENVRRKHQRAQCRTHVSSLYIRSPHGSSNGLAEKVGQHATIKMP